MRKVPKSPNLMNSATIDQGIKRQLKAQDATDKLVRSDILRKVPNNTLFCIKLT